MIRFKDGEFDGYIEILGKDHRGFTRHIIIMIIECKFEKFSKEYSESDKIRKQIEKHLNVIKRNIVPWLNFLYKSDPPVISYLLLANRKISSDVEHVLREMESTCGNNMNIHIGYISGNPLRKIITEYGENVKDDILDLIFQ